MEQVQLSYNQNNLSIYENIKLHDKDHVATPRYVVENIYNIIDIKSFNLVWLPFDNYDSEFKLYSEDLKLQHKATHKFDDLGNDFFVTNPPVNCDLLISNPPFSLQNKIINRTFELIENNLIKSFCLLLPLSTLETEKRSNMYEKYSDKLSVIIFKKRVKFLGHNQVFNKAVCWICYNIDSLKNRKISWI